MGIGNPGFDSLAMLLQQKGQPIPINVGQPFDANRAVGSYMNMLVNKENLAQARKASSTSTTMGGIQTGMTLLSLLASLYGGGAGAGLGGLFGGASSASGIANAGAQMGNVYGGLKYGSGGGLFGR